MDDFFRYARFVIFAAVAVASTVGGVIWDSVDLFGIAVLAAFATGIVGGHISAYKQPPAS